MNKIGLLPNPEKDPDLFYSGRICEFLVQSGAQVYTSPEFAISMPDGVVSVPRAEIFSCADCVVTLGGDGTLLRIAHEAARHSKPIMGVNFGKIGYMAELEYCPRPPALPATPCPPAARFWSRAWRRSS